MNGLRKRVSELELAVLALARLEFYDEDEARDNYGRWTTGNGGGDQGMDVDAFLAARPKEPGEDKFAWQGRIVKDLTPEVQSKVLFKAREVYPAVPYIRDGAAKWCEANGLPVPPHNLVETPCELAEGEAVGRYFEEHYGDPVTPEVEAAYADFRQQSDEQYDYMTRPESEGGLGVKVDFTKEIDPYPSAEAQAADLRDNHHITIQSGLGGAHEATMTQDEYDRFRAVHDVFGHAGVGGGFDRHGEYEAWLMHASMYTGAGRDAMSTEYHGVNSALWGGDPGTPGTGGSLLLPEQWSNPPWDRGTVTASAKQSDADKIVAALGLTSDFAERFESIPWHPNHHPA